MKSVLIFDGILNVLAKDLKYALDNEVLVLLSINLKRDENYCKLELIFAGRPCIMLDAELLHVSLKDLESKDQAGKVTVPKHKIWIAHQKEKV